MLSDRQVNRAIARVEARESMLEGLSKLGLLSSSAVQHSKLALDAVGPEV